MKIPKAIMLILANIMNGNQISLSRRQVFARTSNFMYLLSMLQYLMCVQMVIMNLC